MLVRTDTPVQDEIDALGPAPKKKRGKPELLVQRAVIRTVKECVRGGWAFHVDSGTGGSRGNASHHKLARFRAGVVSGIPDVFACWPPSPVMTGVLWPPGICWFEVKAPGGKVSDQQAHIHSVLRSCGQRVFVVHGVDETLAALRSIGAPLLVPG